MDSPGRPATLANMKGLRYTSTGVLLAVILNFTTALGQPPDARLQEVTLTGSDGKDFPARKLRLRRDIIFSKLIAGQERLILLSVNADRHTGKWNTRGRFIGIDLKTGRVVFIHKTEWPDFHITSHAILLQAGHTLRAISVKDGSLLWEKKHTTMLYVNDSLDFWISQTGTFCTIHGGEQKWTNRIPNPHTIEQVVPLAPDTLLISASGLHWFHLQQGIVHSYPAITDRKYSRGRAQNTVLTISGIMVSAISGVPMYVSANAPSSIFRISSNVLIDGNTLYYASRDSLLKLSRSGKHLWSAPLDAKHTVLQQLIDLGDQLGYINSGIAAGNTRNITTGSPSCHLYDKANGTRTQIVKLPDDESNIIDHATRGETLILLMPHHLVTLRTNERTPTTSYFPLTGSKRSPARLLKEQEALYTVVKSGAITNKIATGNDSVIAVLTTRGHGFLMDLRNGSTQEMPKAVFFRVYQSTMLEVYTSTNETCFFPAGNRNMFCLPGHGSMTKTADAFIFTGKREVYLFPTDAFDPEGG